MPGPHEVVQRGHDSSGRPLKNTRIKWAAFDHINERMGGKLVIVQGAFMGSGGADASAGTHALGGCNDVRRWNLTSSEASQVIQIANSIGDIWWERTAAQGFDPHFHNLLPTDYPLHPDAANQVLYFKRGENGLASHAPDTHSRPSPFPVFQYKEDDMFEASDRELLQRILTRVNDSAAAERGRDAAEAAKDREQHAQVLSLMAKQVDQLGLALNMLKADDSPSTAEVRKLLRENRALLLERLREDPATDGTPDNPSDEAVQDARR